MTIKIRILDVLFSGLGLVFLSPVLVLVFVLGLFDTGAPIFRQKRLGKGKKEFTLIKFRTMNIETRSMASHLVNARSVTKIGKFLRRTKLDELPQLWNVLMGDMTLVGPRPCLANQTDVIAERDRRNIFNVKPGITGLAQLNGIDMSAPQRLAEADYNMIKNMSVMLYFRLILSTALGKGKGDGVAQK